MPRTLATEPLAGAPASEPLASATSRWSIWLVVASLALLWADLIRQLGYEWSTNEQYAYGWFVPILALGLCLRKWPTRPAAKPAGLGPAFSAGIILVAFLLVPIRVAHEINQDWPLISWPLALCVVAISLYAVARVGGLPWVKHFGFPVCFILVAVQWPYRIEHSLTQNLMGVVANINVELLSWINIPAMQRGNLIELANNTVGVDEACSGIRSFQSTMMGALFLGELYLLRWGARLVLVLAGLGIAFLLNVARTFLLSYQAANGGVAALEKWHDPAGFTIAVITFFCLWAIAVWIRRHFFQKPTPPQPSRSAVVPRMGGQFKSLNLFSILLTCMVGLIWLATKVWYRADNTAGGQVSRWSVSLPDTLPSFQPIELAPRTINMLRFDESATGAWRTDQGAEWGVYFFRWNPKSMQSVIRARGHRPEVCLRASGLQRVSGPTLDPMDAGPLRLPFHKYAFETGNGSVYVFFLLWEDGQDQQKGMRTIEPSDRLGWVLARRKHLAQQTLEIICSGYNSLDEADRAVREKLPSLIKFQK